MCLIWKFLNPEVLSVKYSYLGVTSSAVLWGLAAHHAASTLVCRQESFYSAAALRMCLNSCGEKGGECQWNADQEFFVKRSCLALS